MLRATLVVLTSVVVSCAADRDRDRDRTGEPTRERASDVVKRIPQFNSALRAPMRGARVADSITFDLETLAARVKEDGTVRVAATPEAWIEVTPLGRVARPLRDEGLATAQYDVADGTDVVFAATRGKLEELRILRSADAKSRARYRFQLGPGLAAIRAREGRFEAVDANGRVWIAGEHAVAVDARGMTRELTLSVEGDELSLDVDRTGLAFPIVIDPAWTRVAYMKTARAAHTFTLLDDGKVLAVGGKTESYLSSAEVYDVAANTWTSTTALSGVRAGHTATKLASGKVLIVGGSSSAAQLSTAEIYTPGGGFAATGSLAAARSAHAAVVLASGKVMVIGGLAGTSILSTAEIYDPASGTFSAAAAAPSPRSGGRAVLLKDNRVIVVGGNGTMGPAAKLAEIYDPATNTWSDASADGLPRRGPAVALLNDGRVLAAGGYGESSGSSFMSSAETFDVVTSKWTKTPAPPQAFANGKAISLTSGSVLVVGAIGTGGFGLAFGYEPVSNVWSPAPRMLEPSESVAALRLPDGRVLAGGGESFDPFCCYIYSASVEIYAGAENGKSCAVGGDCTSGACADGVCCDRACKGQCESCEIPAKVGTCTMVTGAPRNGRPSCAGAATCNENSFTPAEQCDGMGACKAAPIDCGGFKCTSVGCRMACTDASHCTSGFTCAAGLCIAVASAACEQPGLGASLSAGVRTACNAYLCEAGTGLCRDKCSDSSHCATGFVCGSGTCQSQPAAEATSDEGGCTYGARGPTTFGLALLMTALLARRKRA